MKEPVDTTSLAGESKSAPLRPAEPEPEESASSREAAHTGVNEIVPYVAPMFVFLGLTSLESHLPTNNWYPAAYAAKALAVAIVAWIYRSTWSDFRPIPGSKTLTLATLTGLLVGVIWVGMDGYYPPLPFLGSRAAFDPTVLAPGLKWAFIACRFLGLVLLVPLIEELFWRSFLMRWLIDPDFLRVPVGRVTPAAAVITASVFALSHPEWLPALLTGLLWAGLLWKTGSLFSCFLSHAVANFALGVYVVTTGDWKFW